jgi:hypothetical protein
MKLMTNRLGSSSFANASTQATSGLAMWVIRTTFFMLLLDSVQLKCLVLAYDVFQRVNSACEVRTDLACLRARTDRLCNGAAEQNSPCQGEGVLYLFRAKTLLAESLALQKKGTKLGVSGKHKE